MIHIYTGDGKGKTTAAFGLALRAAGNGLKVYIAQFLKTGNSGEVNAVKGIKNIKVEQFGSGCFIKKIPTKKDIELAKVSLEKIRKIVAKGIYDMIVLDEVSVALHFKLLELKDVASLIKSTPKKIELILTGRHAHPQILKMADLVSEIKEIKHYFKKGVSARKGIEY